MSLKKYILLCTLLTSFVIPAPQPASARQTAGPRVIDVVAKRYAFEPAEIELAVGEAVRLMVRSADGLHGIEIKQFRVKKELERGADPIAIDLTPTRAGRYPILCSEFCGDGHAEMTGALVVVAGDAAPHVEEETHEGRIVLRRGPAGFRNLAGRLR
jgi:cytochrome c oxidase subunit 2